VLVADRNVFLSLGMRRRYKTLQGRADVMLSGFFALECPVVEPTLYGELHRIGSSFKRVYSYASANALAPFLQGAVNVRSFLFPQSLNDVDTRVWRRTERRFLVMVNANKLPSVYLNELYTERMRAVEFFNRYGEVDLYGVGWEGPPFRMGRSRLPAVIRKLRHDSIARWERIRPPRDPLRIAARQANRGPVADKLGTLSGYTFALCFENSVLEGWITEKLFDCFYAGTVPVYWGAPDIEKMISPETFVDMRRFNSYRELREFLHSLSPRDIENFRLAARDFLRSSAFYPFSKEAFADEIERIVLEDLDEASRRS
jgi:hypothetical protein